MYVVSPIAVFVARAIVGSKPDPSSTQDRWRPTKALKNPIAVDFRDRVSEVGNLEVGRRESKCDGRSRQRELDGGVDQIANGLSECSLRGLDAKPRFSTPIKLTSFRPSKIFAMRLWNFFHRGSPGLCCC